MYNKKMIKNWNIWWNIDCSSLFKLSLLPTVWFEVEVVFSVKLVYLLARSYVNTTKVGIKNIGLEDN